MKFNAMRYLFCGILCVPIVVALFVSNASAQVYELKQMNTVQIRALDRDTTVVLLPGGILEQHGPYMPSFTDGYINEALTNAVANAIVQRPGWTVLVFPTIPLGNGGANDIGAKYVFSGTYAIRFSTLRAVFMDLATELGEQGFKWVFVLHFHGHPNHNRALDQAGDYFRETYGGQMVHLAGLMPVYDAWIGAAKALNNKERRENGFAVHADLSETSALLFLRPELVSPRYVVAPAYTGRNLQDLAEVAKAKNWPGYFGSPRLASDNYGAKLWKSISSRVIESALKILDGFDPMEIPRYGDIVKTAPTYAAIANASLAHERQVHDRQQAWIRKNGLR
jgi:creatinine amidohydrolase/Fe(II)-dependent formamide hydrolase-like protein